MRNRSIIIVSILLFSLNIFAQPSYYHFFNYYRLFPTEKNCSLHEIYSDLPQIAEEYVALNYLIVKNDKILFKTQQSQVNAKDGLVSELNQACKKYAAKNNQSTGSTQQAANNTQSNTKKTASIVPSATTNLGNTGSGGNGSSGGTGSGSNGLNNTGATCQYGSTQCGGNVAPSNNAKPKTSWGEKDANGYSSTTEDYGKNKTITVNDENGNRIIAHSTTNENGKQKTEFEAFDQNGKKINLKSLPPEMKDKAADLAKVTGENADKIPDNEKGKEAKKNAKSKDDKSKSETERLKTVNTEVKTIIDKCTDISDCIKASARTKDAEGLIFSAQAEQAKCDGSSSKAHFLCPTATNPQVQAVGGLMNGLAAMMPSISSAKATCAATSSVNLIGQSVLGVATAVCGGFKASCEKTCAVTNDRYKEVKNAYEDIKNSLESALSEANQKKADAKQKKEDAEKNNDPSAQLHALEMQKQDANITAINEARMKAPEIDLAILGKSQDNNIDIAKCDGYKVEIAQISTTAMNMMAASLQAKKCEEQLSAKQGDGSGNAPQTYTMDEMCAQPQNATSSICKCRSDNTAVGCPGHIAGSGNEGNINKTINSPGLAAMAGFGPKVKPSSAFSSGTDLGGLSDEAKVALAANGEQKPSTSMFDQAGGANAGGGGSTSAGAAAAGAKGKVVEESKSMGSSFVNAVSSFFKGGSGGKSAAAKDDKFNADKYKEKIRRQIAAEQMRSEVSSASGMDNWTKIKSRYKSNTSSLIESN